jgi:hypothetical protein
MEISTGWGGFGGGGDLTASLHHTASVSAIWTLVVLDPDPHQSGKLDPIRIRFRIKVMDPDSDDKPK